MGQGNAGPVGTNTNQPVIDGGTNSLSENHPVQSTGANDYGTISANPSSPIMSGITRAKDWYLELNSACSKFGWWVLGSPSMGLPHGGDLEYDREDPDTGYIKNTLAYQEAVQIYAEWLKAGRPYGKFENSLETESEYVSSKGYLYVKGRAAAGSDAGKRADATEVFKHPLWAFTGQFSIRFTPTDYPRDGYVMVEIENFTSLPSFFHGVGSESLKVGVLEKLFTNRSGIPFVSRSRQLYRFIEYVHVDAASTKALDSHGEVPYLVVAGDSLSSIAMAKYGDMDLWPILYEKNQQIIGANPDTLREGLKLQVPAKDKLTADQMEKARQAARHRRSGGITVPPLR